MKRIFVLLSLVLLAAVCALAQTAPPPPNVVLIVREDIKPGKMPAHEQEAATYISFLRKANTRLANTRLADTDVRDAHAVIAHGNIRYKTNAGLVFDMRDGRIAMSPIAGNENEVTYLWAYDSLADMERHHQAMDKLTAGALKADFDALPDHELHAVQRDIIASYRPDLSQGIGRIDIAQARYMVVTTLRLKPGHETEYWKAVKEIVFPARDRAIPTGSWAVYQVRAGVPASTYMIFRPLKSLADLDVNVMAVRNAEGDRADDMDKILDRAVTLTDTTYYAFNPRISLVAPEFAARDTAAPAFWNPAPAGPPVPARPSNKRDRKEQH